MKGVVAHRSLRGMTSEFVRDNCCSAVARRRLAVTLPRNPCYARKPQVCWLDVREEVRIAARSIEARREHQPGFTGHTHKYK